MVTQAACWQTDKRVEVCCLDWGQGKRDGKLQSRLKSAVFDKHPMHDYSSMSHAQYLKQPLVTG